MHKQAVPLGIGSSLEPTSALKLTCPIRDFADYAAKGFTNDQYVTFLAWGWKWGGQAMSYTS
jgi:hypothetical protein